MAENKNAQQVREITDKLEQGIKELFESERFKEYLRTMSKFYNYSFNNTLLIAMQKPEATYVAGYTSWPSLVACSMSLDAPVVMEPNTTSSAARPPVRVAILFSSSSLVIR